MTSRHIAAALASAALLAGCGSSGASHAHGTAQAAIAAAHCLENEIADRVNFHPISNCAFSGAYRTVESGSTASIRTLWRFSAACTHEQANQYICTVTGSGTKRNAAEPLSAPNIPGGFYAVVYDGHSITYRLAH